MKSNNRLDSLFAARKPVLSVYLTAGYPALHDTVPLCETLQHAGADMIEIGFPFSDPVADGPVIQRCSEIALQNGMGLELLFRQLQQIRRTVTVPLLLMGYINPVLQYGFERFCKDASACGIDGLIIPDLPLSEFERNCSQLCSEYDLAFVPLIAPQTPDARIKEIDAQKRGFIYAVSSAAVTGSAIDLDAARLEYFRRLRNLKLNNPLMIGFGISDRKTFTQCTEYAAGAIIGSAFLRELTGAADLHRAAAGFIRNIKDGK